MPRKQYDIKISRALRDGIGFTGKDFTVEGKLSFTLPKDKFDDLSNIMLDIERAVNHQLDMGMHIS